MNRYSKLYQRVILQDGYYKYIRTVHLTHIRDGIYSEVEGWVGLFGKRYSVTRDNDTLDSMWTLGAVR